MGFGFPKDERAALVAAHPERFFMPIQSDLRYNWVRVWLDAIDQQAWVYLTNSRAGRAG
jgi:hypothetical protein